MQSERRSIWVREYYREMCNILFFHICKYVFVWLFFSLIFHKTSCICFPSSSFIKLAMLLSSFLFSLSIVHWCILCNHVWCVLLRPHHKSLWEMRIFFSPRNAKKKGLKKWTLHLTLAQAHTSRKIRTDKVDCRTKRINFHICIQKCWETSNI